MMHLLERIAARFNEEGVPLMALKGAALSLALSKQPGQRPMLDLDLLVRVEDADRAQALLEDTGCLRSDIVFREDFFPKYYYEIEYTAGSVDPVLIDLHVRPFRLLRYARLVPDDGLWADAVPVIMGGATVMIPSPDDMLIHLATHSAIHGNCRDLWLRDIGQWVGAHGESIDWDRFLRKVRDWRLALPVRSALEATRRAVGDCCPRSVRRTLAVMPGGWRDRLTLWHATRDGTNLTASFLISLLTTPGWRFKLGYLRDVLLPDRAYMDAWRARHNAVSERWPLLQRFLAPIMRHLPRFRRSDAKIDVRRSSIHGLGVFAKCEIRKGEPIARYRGRPSERDGTYVAYHTDAAGHKVRHEITGPLRFLNHSCRPNAKLVNFTLRALHPIRCEFEIKVDYGPEACGCRRNSGEHEDGRGSTTKPPPVPDKRRPEGSLCRAGGAGP